MSTKTSGTKPATSATAARPPKKDKPAATVEVPYPCPSYFWTASRDGAKTYAVAVPGVQSATADNARRVLVLAGTKAGTQTAAAKIAAVWPAAVAALREQDAQQREEIREQRKTREGRAARWANEKVFIAGYVADALAVA